MKKTVVFGNENLAVMLKDYLVLIAYLGEKRKQFTLLLRALLYLQIVLCIFLVCSVLFMAYNSDNILDFVVLGMLSCIVYISDMLKDSCFAQNFDNKLCFHLGKLSSNIFVSHWGAVILIKFFGKKIEILQSPIGIVVYCLLILLLGELN